MEMEYRLLDFRQANTVAEINGEGEIIINDPAIMIDMKLDVVKRLREWKDGEYKWEPLDATIVLLGRIAELEMDLGYAYDEIANRE